MGVKGLWTILAPTAQKKALWELKDQTVAIDLSGWICENQLIDNFNANLYLRNLFFRTSYMLLVGIKPIFILEGKAPTLKHSTIERRRILSGSSTVSDENSKKNRGNRSRLNSMQKQCEDLLKSIGVSCYYSEGEAEALCALLNKENIVDAVISQDSDCFLYGAKTVYRNFTIGSCGGSVEVYTLSSIEKKLSLGRNKLIALSLLCGCDYNDSGILGIGKESALKYLSMCTDSEVLTRLSSWRSSYSSVVQSNSNVTSLSKLEWNLVRKALQNPEFPFLEVQKEFLENQSTIKGDVIFEWKQPNIKHFVMLTERLLGWNTNYSLEKCVPLLSRWHLLYDNSSKENIAGSIQLERVVKKRTLRNVPSYEVKWKDFETTTIEPYCIFRVKYENAVQDYESTKKKTNKSKKTKKKEPENFMFECDQQVEIDDVINNLSHLDIQATADDSLTVSDFECSARDLLELSSIVESIASGSR
ncbi:flap endonuclease GEN [Planococcus citri]|uniref:flap endonuclease GEN n=1 Tax=Planococcus citri TaxID=170843 RepID=UPI0031F9C807